MKNSSLEKIIREIPEINPNRNYWFVRTNGGQYYDDFYKSGFVAIGWDKIDSSTIKKVSESKLKGYIAVLAKKVRREFREEMRPMHAAFQIYKFVHGIKRGDIVICPSHNSAFIAFGMALSSESYTKKVKTDDPNICTWYKRKKIKWFDVIQRSKLDPNLYKLMYSQHTITEGALYAEYIDRVLNSVYIKNETVVFTPLLRQILS